jgi:hypothetical protein
MTRRAVVSYAVDATDEQKVQALKDGLQECAGEMIELGADPEELQEALDSARDYGEFIWEDQQARGGFSDA